MTVAAALLLSCALAAGCSESGGTSATPASTAAEAAPAAEALEVVGLRQWSGSQSITLDGDIGEWPDDVAVVADEHWLYFRMKLEGDTRTLQSMETPVAMWIDADGDPSTGRAIEKPRVEGGLGADIEIVFSPRDPDAPRTGQGLMFRVHGPDGQSRVVPHDALGFSFTPSHAAEWYEGRIARHAAEELGLAAPGLASRGRVAGVVAMLDRAGEVAAWADPFEVDAPSAQPRAGVDVRVPERPASGVRVLSWNVEHTSPAKNPEPFARLLAVLRPDAILLQEWTEGDANDIKAWLTAHVSDEVAWDVIKGPAWGVAIAAPHPLTPITDPTTPNPMRPDRALRFLGAVVETPNGPVALGSTHLKCCGSKDSSEDRQRMAEAELIARMMDEALGAEPASGVWATVLGGDLNLVGSRPPLDAISVGLDGDGSALAVADAMVLGDAAMHTWYDAGNAFTPGRLDFMLYSDSTARAANAFVLDTTLLGEAALARLGVDADDSRASDHMPLVLDIVPAR